MLEAAGWSDDSWSQNGANVNGISDVAFLGYMMKC